MLPYINPRSFSNGSAVKNLPIMQKVQETQVWSLGQENPLEDEMSSHFSILAWETPWTEESSRLQSMGLQRVDRLSNWACTQVNAIFPCGYKCPWNISGRNIHSLSTSFVAGWMMPSYLSPADVHILIPSTWRLMYFTW